MKKIVLLLFFFAVQIFARDPIYDMRFTMGTDANPVPKFGGGVAVRTHFNSQTAIPVTLMGAISRNFEIGAKFNMVSYNEFEDINLFLDIGGRYRFGAGKYLEVDGYFGLNRNEGSAVIVSLGSENFIASSFSNLYELRAGFLDGVTGHEGYAKIVASMTPTLRFGSLLHIMMELNASASIGHFKDDFMVDIIPKLELFLGAARIKLDFDIGVLQEDNNSQKNLTLGVIFAF